MNKIAQIIPAMRLKRQLNYFDYTVPEELSAQIKVGQIVEIPFRQRQLKGVVLNLQAKSDSAYELKPILKILDSEPYFKTWRLALIKFMAEKYFVSMAMILKMMWPEMPKRKSQKIKIIEVDFKAEPKLQIDADFILSSKKPLLLAYATGEYKIYAYLAIIKNNLKHNKQTVIIVPEIINISKIYEYLGEYQDLISVFLNNLNKNQTWAEWSNIKNNTAKIIIGTRSAIFAPFNDLGTIIIDEEDNANHKQEEPNPRFNAKEVALQISKLTGAKIVFASATPSFNSLYYVQTKVWDYLSLDKPKELPQIKLINRQDEFKRGNFSIVNEDLQLAILENLKQKKKSFLFLNRKGSATLVSCQDCGHVAVCPTCTLPLTFYKKSAELQCHHCGYKTGLYLTCPKCQGAEIKFTGTGTEKAEAELKALFPQAKILLVDLDNQNQQMVSQAEIIIGTQFAFDYIDWPEIQTVGILNADTLFYVPDYRSAEKTYNLLYKLILNMAVKDKEVYCQTMVPENDVFTAIRQFKTSLFYLQEIKERRDFQYPPFSRLIKLIFQSLDFNGGLNEINEIYNRLKLKVADNNKIIINPPQPAYTQQVRGRWRWLMIIKILDIKTDLNFLNDFPENLIIDVDPENLN